MLLRVYKINFGGLMVIVFAVPNITNVLDKIKNQGL